MTRAIVAILVAAVLALGGYLLTRGDDPTPTTQPQTTQNTQPQNTQETANNEEEAAATITYNGSSFSPSTVTVKSGDRITVKNDSSAPLDFASDQHPTHTDNSELNIGTVNAGESRTFTVTTTGTWGYHNHLNETQTSTIIVE